MQFFFLPDILMYKKPRRLSTVFFQFQPNMYLVKSAWFRFVFMIQLYEWKHDWFVLKIFNQNFFWQNTFYFT